MKRKFILPILILLAVGIDQWVKFYVVENIALNQVKDFLPGLVNLTYLQNRGAAFSILQNQQWFFSLVTIVVVIGATWYLFKNNKRDYWEITSLSLIIAGGLGNFIDRVRQGFVVDMFQFDFVNFAIFNVADSYLTIGVLLMIVTMIKEEISGSKN